MIVVLSIFPVYINVFEAVSGSSENPIAASLAAAKTLAVLTLKSRIKSACERDNGFSASLRVAAAARICQPRSL
jgi:hypothetical protein